MTFERLCFIFSYRATKYLLAWEGFRRLYFFVMTENMRAILRRWQKQLFPEDFKQSKAMK